MFDLQHNEVIGADHWFDAYYLENFKKENDFLKEFLVKDIQGQCYKSNDISDHPVYKACPLLFHLCDGKSKHFNIHIPGLYL